MNKAFSVVMAFVLLATAALAATDTDPVTVTTGVGIGVGVTPTNSCPEIVQEHCSYAQEGMEYSVCYYVDVSADWDGRMCGSEACATVIGDALLNKGVIGRSYAFEGEQIHFKTVVVDVDGIIDDCVHVYVTLDNGYDPIEAGCSLLSVYDWTDPHTGQVYKNAVGEFSCTYTVEPAESGTVGEYWISVSAIDGCGGGCADNAAGVISLYLNPAVSLTISSQDQFGFMYDANGNRLSAVGAGSTVYTPYFTVENSADPSTGLYILLQLYGTDMWDYDSSAALCPNSNVLDIRNVQYKASHLNVQQPWTTMFRNAGNKEFVFNQFPTNFMGNFLGVGDDVTMRLRLNIPTPCRGNFDDGGQIVFVGHVI